MSLLRERISGLLSRSAAQVGTSGAGAAGSRASGPCSAALDLDHELRLRRPQGPCVRAYEVRECCGGQVRRETVLLRVAGR